MKGGGGGGGFMPECSKMCVCVGRGRQHPRRTINDMSHVTDLHSYIALRCVVFNRPVRPVVFNKLLFPRYHRPIDTDIHVSP